MVSEQPDVPLLDWVARWRVLSAPARLAVVREVRAPVSPNSTRPPFISINRLPANVVDELTAAGFVERRPGLSARQAERLIVPPAAAEFVNEVQDIAALRLLDAGGPPNLGEYVRSRFNPNHLNIRVSRVLREIGLDIHHVTRAILLEQYIPEPEWPDWAARSLNDPVA